MIDFTRCCHCDSNNVCDVYGGALCDFFYDRTTDPINCPHFSFIQDFSEPIKNLATIIYDLERRVQDLENKLNNQ
jgi:hypothetical protein